MSAQVSNYKCPACTGPLHFVGATGKLECDYCGGSYEVAEIEAMLREQNEEAARAMAESRDSQWELAQEQWLEQGMKAYSCPSCGAELICDENTAATCCPYCGNQTVVPGQFSGSLMPDFVIPFKTDREQAKSALKNHYKGKALLPKSFVSGNHIEDVQGVYVPFWLFDCRAEGRMSFSATTVDKRRQGEREITITKYFDVHRAGSLSFEKVPVDASSRMPDEHMDSIEPYDYNELKPFSMAYMPGFLADRYDEDVEKCGARMQERCEKTFVEEIEKTVTGYSTRCERSRAVTVQKGAVHYAMMPVWLLATKWNEQSFLFAMNGQTGKLIGDLPCDKGKYWGFFAGIGAVLIALMQLLNLFVFNPSMTGAAMALFTVLLPLLVAFIAVSVMKGQLKSVLKQRAKGYISGGGLHLSQKQDIYLRTQTTERIIKQQSK